MNALKLSAGLKWLSLGALAVAFAVHCFTDYALGGASPLGLLLTAAGGWLLQQKVALVGNLLLLFAGGALVLFPFLNEAPIVYTFLGLPLLVYGLSSALQWWRKEGI